VGLKEWKQFRGVLALTRGNPQRTRKLLSLQPVEEIWGVGNRIARKLNVLGIRTALDLALTNPAFIRKNFSVVLERTVRELNGESCMSLEEAPPTKQQIVCSRSFGEKITEYDSLRQAVCQYAERASEKLRKERQYCRHISVFIKTSPFAVKEPYYGNVATEKLLTPTQDTRDIIAAATTALERIWKDGHRYAKAGVMLNDFTGSGVSQLQLFDERPPRPHSAELMKVLDGINHSGWDSLVCRTRDCAIMANETRYALPCVHHPLERYPHCEDQLNFAFQREPVVLAAAERQGEARE
jgi:DNA polymerase V